MNTYRKRLISMLLAGCFMTCYGDNIHGTVKDTKGKGVPFANVALISKADSSLIAGAVTGDDGHFVLEATTDEALLKVSCIGYADIYRPVSPSPITIVMKESVTNLEGVVIKTQRPAYKLTDEGLTTGVVGTMLSRLGSGMDVLAHLPGVSIKNGNIEIFGKGAPLVYINGRRVYSNAEIDNLKSDDIKEVEVITSPEPGIIPQ